MLFGSSPYSVFLVGCNIGVYYIVPLYLTKELAMDVHYANTILLSSWRSSPPYRPGPRRAIWPEKSMFGVMLATGLSRAHCGEKSVC